MVSRRLGEIGRKKPWTEVPNMPWCGVLSQAARIRYEIFFLGGDGHRLFGFHQYGKGN